jgi:hypothetical protein
MAKTDGSRKYFQQQLFDEIKKQIGNNNMLTIPVTILHYAGDLFSAVFLSQLIYWCDKGKSTDGYIFKTYEDWKWETLLSEYLIKKSSKKFQGMGILHTKKKKANGAPTIHYKLDLKAFMDTFQEFLINHTEIFRNENLKTSDSLTEPTSYPSSEPSKKDIREFCNKQQNPVLSFKDYCKIFPSDDTEAVEAIDYFLQAFKRYRGDEHPRLSTEQWHGVITTILSCGDDFGDGHDLDLDAIEAMTERYFEIKFQEGCNYSVLHFNSEGVKRNRMYEAAY